MSKNTEDQIKHLISMFCKANPKLHTQSEEKYLKDFIGAFSNVEDYLIQESIKICIDREFYETKNIMYFRGIVMSKKQEHEKRKTLEEKILTPIPRKIV